MSFLGHLEELRWHVVRALIAIVIFTIVSFVFSSWIFDNIVFAPARASFPTFTWLCKLGQLVNSPETFCPQEIKMKIQSRYMTGQFSMQVMASFIIGIIAAFPYVFWELWRFVKPGLRSSELKVSKGAVFWVTLLFLSGILFGYFVLCPITIFFLANYQISEMIVNEFDITSYVSTIVALVFGSGMLFQLPIVIYFLTKIGLLTPAFLKKYRKHAIVIILIIAAIITPPDPLSQTLIFIPLYLLFEISIILSSRVAKNKAKQSL